MPFNTLTVLSILVINIHLSLKVVFALHFEASGFETCVFNLVYNDSVSDAAMIDLIEKIITSNHEKQAWTISGLTDSLNRFDTKLRNFPLGNPLLERCSVNFIIPNNGCFATPLSEVFGLRLNNIDNMFVVINGDDVLGCGEFKLEVLLGTRNTAVAYKLVLSSATQAPLIGATLDLEDNHFSLSTSVRRIPLGLSLTNFQNIRQFATHVRTGITVQSILVMSGTSGLNLSGRFDKYCYFLYQLRQSTRPLKICCYPPHIVMENIAAKLNYSISYFNYYDRRTWIHAQAKVIFANLWFFHPLSNHRQILRYVGEQKFLYCTKSEQRKSFSLEFWTIPLDFWSWIFLLLSSVLLTVVVRGEWLEIYAILMRQSCSILNRNKLLLIFMFATIIFTYGYEGIVSSIITVPPPLIVVRTLKDLIDAGYKIIMPGQSLVNEIGRLFEAENITSYDVRSSIVIYSPNTSGKRNFWTDLMHACNTTAASDSKSGAFLLVDDRKPDIRCQFVSESKVEFPEVLHYFGYASPKVSHLNTLMSESGMSSMYQDMYDFLKMELSGGNRHEWRMNRRDAEPVPFKIINWKILSIFLGWAFLLGFNFLVFFVELLFYPVRKLSIVCVTKVIGNAVRQSILSSIDKLTRQWTVFKLFWERTREV